MLVRFHKRILVYQLSDMYNGIGIKALDQGQQLWLIVYNVSKAFDKV